MKNFYIAVQIKENDKFYAYVIKVSKSDNLLSKLEIPNIITANICQSKKEAENMCLISWVRSWNDGFKANDAHYYFCNVKYVFN